MGMLLSALRRAMSLKEILPRRGILSPQCSSQLQAVERARLDWLIFGNYYQQIRDPELVEHAAFELKARERRYMYLLTRAKTAGLRLDDVTFGNWLFDRGV